MLVARRDPPFHTDADDVTPVNSGVYSAVKASRFTRFVTAIQMVGSLLAVPVGIASAYSFYRANFSPEITCQSLRSGIVAMLDKSVDAATRRILVRRDVEAFEKTCAAVDPDATAAFKALLAVEKTSAPVAALPVAPKVQHSETASKEPVRKAEPRQQAPVRQPVTAAAPVLVESTRRDPGISDAQWLDAVRQALATHKEETPAPDAAKPQSAPVPAMRPASHDAVLSPPPAAIASTPAVAPALPPAIPIAPPPAAQAHDDHPVPPESIPDAASPGSADIARPEEHDRSRISKWISAIPLLGPTLDNGRH
ncbi:MAG TPA: hypothetical protein VI358_05665 [Pseudolabrys sp.]